jgi:opacity protein-like surface antigen
MRKTAILIAALAGLLLTAQASAQAPGQGFYVGLGGGTVWSKGGQIYNDTVNEDASLGGKVFAGYMATDNWGMELALHSLGRYETEFANAKISDMRTTALSVSGVYTRPLFESGFNVNVRLGLVFTEAKYTCVSLCGPTVTPGLANVNTRYRGVAGTIGLGIGAKITQALSMRVDFDHFGNVKHQVDLTEFNESYDVLSANLQLLF